MVALISPQHVFHPAPHKSDRLPRSGARHLHAVPSIGDLAGLAVPELVLPEFELGRRLAAAVPPLRPMLVKLDDVVDAIRWGGSAGLRFALVATALVVAVISVRVSQGVPPADAPSSLVPSAAQASPVSGDSAATSGDVVLSFSAAG